MLSYLSVTILKTFFNSEYLISLIFAATCTTRNCIYTWQKYAQLRDFDIGWRFSRKMKSFQKWCWLTTSSPILSTVTLNWNSLFDKSFTLCFNRNFSFWLATNNILLLQVHPCGRYRHNTVVFILAKEYNLKNLRTIHRLDRLTSGLLMFGRNPRKAREMEQQIRNRQVLKEYVCRVEGEFPE